MYDNGRSPSILFSPDMLLNNMAIIEETLEALEPSSLTPLPTSLFVPGQPCLSRFSGDGVLYRASVCSAPQDDLVEVMYVDYGNSEKNMREAFKLAISLRPCILFFDEIGKF